MKSESRSVWKNWAVPLVVLYLTAFVVCAGLPLLGGWAPLALFLCLPFTLYFYGYIHDWVHRGAGLKKFDASGIAAVLACAPLGMSWIIYSRHHWNHHQFNNGDNDYSKTTDRSGKPMTGAAYLWKTTLYPALLQLIPFLSVTAMKPSHRTLLAWFDESMRVGIRITVLVVFGFPGLISLLGLQFGFLANLFYVNYLQHLDCGPGNTVVWSGATFNRWTHNLGFHQHHHAEPQAVSESLRPDPSTVVYRAGWNDPIAFVLFLFSPDQLRSWLSVKEIA